MKRIPSFVLVLVLEGANAEKQIALDLNNSACSREEKKKNNYMDNLLGF